MKNSVSAFAIAIVLSLGSIGAAAAVGQSAPAAPRAARHGFMSGSVRVRPLSPPIGQLRPSAKRKLVTSARPPSR